MIEWTVTHKQHCDDTRTIGVSSQLTVSLEAWGSILIVYVDLLTMEWDGESLFGKFARKSP
jgi:hypothetical protein